MFSLFIVSLMPLKNFLHHQDVRVCCQHRSIYAVITVTEVTPSYLFVVLDDLLLGLSDDAF